MHRVVSLGDMDTSVDGGVSLDHALAFLGTGAATVAKALASEELWDALWEATLQLYHGAVARLRRA